MNQTDRRRFRIDYINRAAIGDPDPEGNMTLVCEQSIAAGELVICPQSIDHSNIGCVNLFGGNQRPIAYSDPPRISR